LRNIITGRSTSSEETADHVPYQTQKEREIETEGNSKSYDKRRKEGEESRVDYMKREM
jgi:hypothetical protein